jgi:peptidoglycan hydrolase-like protein with peptidoglycan-binding domain
MEAIEAHRGAWNRSVRWDQLLVLVAILAVQTPPRAHALNMDTVNAAKLPAKPTQLGKGINPAVIKVQVLLDRAHFSPGEIDGRLEENTRKAIATFGGAHGLSPDGKLSPQVWSGLVAASEGPIVKQYTIVESDVKGPFLEKLPSKMEEMSNLQHLSYTSPRQEIAERFHMSQGLLTALNPGKSFAWTGETILVANVDNDPLDQKVARIEVDKGKRELRVYAGDDGLLFAAPATIGSPEKPAPGGNLRVTSVTHNPTYRYNPAYHFKGVHTTGRSRSGRALIIQSVSCGSDCR